MLVKMNFTLYAWVDKTPARLARVENALKNAVRIAPESGETYLVRGRWYMHERDWPRALDAIIHAGKLLPGSVDVLTDASDVESRLGLWKEATRDLEKAKELDPANPNIPNGLEDLYSGLRDYKRSDQVADAAIAKFPHGPGYFQASKVQNAINRGDTKAARVALGSDCARVGPKWNHFGHASGRGRGGSQLCRGSSFDRHHAKGKSDRIQHCRSWLFRSARRTRAGRQRQSAIRSRFDARTGHSQLARAIGRSSTLLARLARIDAYLGRNDDALREIARATELAHRRGRGAGYQESLRRSLPLGGPTRQGAPAAFRSRENPIWPFVWRAPQSALGFFAQRSSFPGSDR